MIVEPSTRLSLMVRLRDPQDQAAWTEFVAIYEPLLLRLMRQRGLQEADARDATQQVILAVTQLVDRWQPDGREASFRRWLFTIARRLSLKSVQCGRPLNGVPRRGAGGSEMVDLLDGLPDPDQGTVFLFNDEYRNQLFHRAAETARGEFREPTWQAFWRTCMLQESIAHVAADLRMDVGKIYVARSRVIARMRQIVEEFEADHVA